MDRSLRILLILFAVAILGAPLIFYGLIAMANAGVFDGALGNFWLLAGTGLALIVGWWVAVLYIGERLQRRDSADSRES